MHLSFRRFRVDDAVLAGDLITVALLVIPLYALVLVELGLEKGLEGLQLCVLGVAGAVCRLGKVALESLDAVLDGRVADLGLGDVLLELVIGLAVSAAEGALVKLANVVDVVCETLDVIAQGLYTAQEVLLRQGGGWLLGGVAVGVAVGIVLHLILLILIILLILGVGVLLW